MVYSWEVVHAWEAEAGRSLLSLWPAWAAESAQDQPKPHSETLKRKGKYFAWSKHWGQYGGSLLLSATKGKV